MKDWESELKAFWKKYKDAETDEEWFSLVDEAKKFDDPVVLPRIVKCLSIIWDRYNEKVKLKNCNTQ